MDKTPIKIMQVVLSLDCGGLEKLAIDLSETLNKGGFHSSICCLDNFGELADQARARGIEVFLERKNPGIDVTLPFRLANVLKREKINIVHTHNIIPLLYGTLAARLAGVPVINTRHGREKRSVFSFIWKMNKRVVSISKDAKTELLKSNHIDINKVRIVYNGISAKKFLNTKTKGEIKKALKIDPSALVVGTVARLSPEKDQFTLLDSFFEVAKRRSNVKLIFVGNGVLKEDLQKHAKELGLFDKVIFLGFRNDIAEILGILNVFVLSSLMEGISLTLLEAMAASLPIVATQVGGNPEVVLEGVTGLLVPPKKPIEMADAIDKLLSNEDLAKKMGEAGKRRVYEEFQLDRMSREYIELYKECLAGVSV